MKFYDCATAPSPRRARIFMAEKGLDIETVEVDLRNGEQFSDAFRTVNPNCTVPVLELDDGTAITENVGIARYLEEICPDPPLLGRDAREKALVAMWNARVEFEGLYAVAETLRNSTPGFEGRALTGPQDHPQIPELAKRGRRRVQQFVAVLNDHLNGRRYIVDDYFSLADITALVTIDFLRWIKVEVPEACTDLRRWHAEVGSRPSAEA